jgi:hypothetical protein
MQKQVYKPKSFNLSGLNGISFFEYFFTCQVVLPMRIRRFDHSSE